MEERTGVRERQGREGERGKKWSPEEEMRGKTGSETCCFSEAEGKELKEVFEQ